MLLEVESRCETVGRVRLSGLRANVGSASHSIHSYIPKDNSLQSETVHYKRGVCQQFCLPSHTVDPSEWAEEEVSCCAQDPHPEDLCQQQTLCPDAGMPCSTLRPFTPVTGLLSSN